MKVIQITFNDGTVTATVRVPDGEEPEAVFEKTMKAQGEDPDVGDYDWEEYEVQDPPAHAEAEKAFAKLVRWAKSKGKTEQDVVDWIADSEARATAEQDTEDLVAVLKSEDGVRFDRTHVVGRWADFDEDTRKDYRESMKDTWQEESK